MYKKKRVLAIITARGGSKGLPGKNIKKLLDKPLIAWSIIHGLESKYVDEVVVTTDDRRIAEISRTYGANVPFIRPSSLATDTATTIDVIEHTIHFLKEQKEYFDVIVLLEPTSPLREIKDIDIAIELVIDTPKAESLVGVSEVEGQHPDFLATVKDGFLIPYNTFEVKRRQDISKLFFFEGSVYCSYTDALLRERNFYHANTLGYIVPKWQSFEIDDLTDFLVVEKILEERLKGTI